MKLPWPREIRCGSHTYQVVQSTERRLEDSGLGGDVNHRTQVVAINALRPASDQTRVLLHEAAHIVNRIFGCGDKLGEETIERQAEGLAQVLQGWGIEFDWKVKEGQDAETD